MPETATEPATEARKTGNRGRPDKPQGGAYAVEEWDTGEDGGGDWIEQARGLANPSEARHWIKKNLKPGTEFRIIELIQEGAVVGKNDVLVAD